MENEEKARYRTASMEAKKRIIENFKENKKTFLKGVNEVRKGRV